MDVLHHFLQHFIISFKYIYCIIIAVGAGWQDHQGFHPNAGQLEAELSGSKDFIFNKKKRADRTVRQ